MSFHGVWWSKDSFMLVPAGSSREDTTTIVIYDHKVSSEKGDVSKKVMACIVLFFYEISCAVKVNNKTDSFSNGAYLGDVPKFVCFFLAGE